ncbi:OLC1v1022948C1 [Oldenlandia corymbosa var. corymbosa]|uniref:OLC1v1022948C1 n=1 Tax=Oldenlandia corymbosa var. corymbosa TaxID=529605 RepID=A0AAV1BZD6_OLDCO|nr:OLC1v1022948C1 [Oldenlandia corymbosa var. corymbosa]
MATDDEKVYTHEEKIEKLEYTVDNLKKAIEDLQRTQDEKLQQLEDRFQKFEAMHSGSATLKQCKETRGNKAVMDHVVNQELHPGPIDESVLNLQHDHRSTSVWRGQDFEPLTCRRCDGAFWRLGALDPRVQKLMIKAGFYGVYKAGHIQLDHALITALVERWRQETHTFHLPIGEATVTLQDVSVMWGLPIDGEPVTGHDITRTTEEWQEMCEELLGFRPPLSAFDSGRLKLKCIEDHFDLEPLQPDAPDHVVEFFARAHILQLLGGLLLPDASNNKVKLMFLPLLWDFDAAGKLSWGSAVLASLYRALCRATKPNVDGVCGPLVLLQLWAWERIPLIRPERLTPREQSLHVPSEEDHPLPAGPYGSRWDVGFKLEKIGMHVLVVYRDILDCMKDDQFVWQPYAYIIGSLPDYCLSGREIWQTVSPLLCFDVVEMHYPDRVLRQFGQHQNIPSDCDTFRELHSVDRRGRQNTDWVQHHKQYVDMWSNRRARVVCQPLIDGPMGYSDPYMIWYRRITRLLIGNPANRTDNGYQGVGGIIELMAQSLQRIYHRCIDAINQSDEGANSDTLREIQDICKNALRGAHEDRRLALRPELAQPSIMVGKASPSQVKRRRPRRGGKIGTLLGERSAYSSGDIYSPSAHYTMLPCTPSSQPYPSPSYSHEAFTPDVEPYVTLAPEVAHEEIPTDNKVETDASLSEHIDIVTVAPMQQDSSTMPQLINSPQPNISELDNMVGAIAVSPSSATDMFIPSESLCSQEDDMIMSVSERSKLKKRKAKC